MHCPFISTVLHFFFIFFLFPFLLFPAAVVPCFFHPSFLFSVSYALFPPFHLIFRTGCCCLRFSMHCPFISAVRRFFFIFLLFPFLLFPAAVVPCFFILLFYFPYLTLFSCLFSLFFAPVVAAFAFRCITPSYRLSGAFSSFSLYSPSFCSPLRSFRAFCHPSFLFTAPYALSLTFFLIFRAGCFCAFFLFRAENENM